MDLKEHFHLTAGALKHWLIAQFQDSLAVALLWWLGLTLLKVPWAPLWALLAAALQIVPHLGPVLSLIGPALAAAWHWEDWEHPLYVLMLYAAIVMVDGSYSSPTSCAASPKCLCGPPSSCQSFWGSSFLFGESCWPRRCWPCCTRISERWSTMP